MENFKNLDFIFECPECERKDIMNYDEFKKYFLDKHDYQRGFREVHTIKGQYLCPYCPYLTRGKTRLVAIELKP